MCVLFIFFYSFAVITLIISPGLAYFRNQMNTWPQKGCWTRN